MLRFIALVCDGSESAAQASGRLTSKLSALAGWRSVHIGPRAVVFYKSERDDRGEIHLLPDQSGVILGRLFQKPDVTHHVARRVELDQQRAAAIVASGGRALIDRYWGRYVAFLHEPESRSTYVLRDPTGHLPCFRYTIQGVNIYFSNADCLDLGLPRFSINWSFVAAYLCNWRLQNRETGLDEVAEVAPGECVEHHFGGATRSLLYWNPVEISRSQPFESFDAAVQELRGTTRACIWAWASCYPGIVHSLSGGLDSSIVLSCLRTAPSQPSITCLHYFHDAATDTDERRFARAAASHLDCKLIERQLDASSVKLEALSGVAKCPRPAVYQYSVQQGSFENELAVRTGASAVFKGIGGDQVFFQGQGELAVSDYLYSRALLSAWRLSGHVARAERTSVWSVLKSGWARGLLRRPCDPLAHMGRPQPLVRPEVVAAVRGNERWIHPWLRSIDGVPEGKLQHVGAMSHPFAYYDPLQRLVAAERVHPLFSQPVMEVCLRTPTYFMAAGGRDRAVARQAFAQDLPKSIVARRGKAGLDSYLHRVGERNLQYIKAMLLDGHLVKQQLLDRRRVEAALTAPRSRMREELNELLVYHLSTEAWINSWSAA
ncbi:MAG TPA: asparagine synthase-related protein [Steroidobacter sp.]|uniref:asparagine synthase-related protein n=1 Tax=Steroidobacter sp. TaxID=1978227 RepID=UPI002ED8E8A8